MQQSASLRDQPQIVSARPLYCTQPIFTWTFVLHRSGEALVQVVRLLTIIHPFTHPRIELLQCIRVLVQVVV